MIFHEVYGTYYRVTASILKEAAKGQLTEKKMYHLIQEYGLGESSLTIPEGLTGEKWKVLKNDLSTPLKKEPSMPVTLLEKRWMKALLSDPRICLFNPDISGLEDVEPLFTPDMFVYYDRYKDGDAYSDPAYIKHFQTILKALNEKQTLSIDFETGHHNQKKLLLTPYYLEYSEKDDRFRLIASGKNRNWTINLSRIRECHLAGQTEHFPIIKAQTETLTFELVDQRKSLERVLLHFSHLEKETKRLAKDRYEVTLKYDKQDETEMIIRILSFGPMNKVTRPSHFIKLLKSRIDKQLELLSIR